MSLPDQGVSSVRQRMQRIPGPVLDVGLALMVAVAMIIAIGLSPNPGRPPDAARFYQRLLPAFAATAAAVEDLNAWRLDHAPDGTMEEHRPEEAVRP
jgi:hypothetical protein